MAVRMTRADLQGIEGRAIEQIRDGELQRFRNEVHHDVVVAASFGQRCTNIYVTNWVTLGKALMRRRNHNDNTILQQDELNTLLNTCKEILNEMFVDVDINVMYQYNEPYIHVNWS